MPPLPDIRSETRAGMYPEPISEPVARSRWVTCPFRKRYPRRHMLMNNSCTSLWEFDSIPTVTEHLRRYHSRKYGCIRCKTRLTRYGNDPINGGAHQCVPRAFVFDDPIWMDEQQEERFMDWTLSGNKQSTGSVQKYNEIYITLFPNFEGYDLIQPSASGRLESTHIFLSFDIILNPSERWSLLLQRLEKVLDDARRLQDEVNAIQLEVAQIDTGFLLASIRNAPLANYSTTSALTTSFGFQINGLAGVSNVADTATIAGRLSSSSQEIPDSNTFSNPVLPFDFQRGNAAGVANVPGSDWDHPQQTVNPKTFSTPSLPSDLDLDGMTWVAAVARSSQGHSQQTSNQNIFSAPAPPSDLRLDGRNDESGSGWGQLEGTVQPNTFSATAPAYDLRLEGLGDGSGGVWGQSEGILEPTTISVPLLYPDMQLNKMANAVEGSWGHSQDTAQPNMTSAYPLPSDLRLNGMADISGSGWGQSQATMQPGTSSAPLLYPDLHLDGTADLAGSNLGHPPQTVQPDSWGGPIFESSGGLQDPEALQQFINYGTDLALSVPNFPANGSST